MPRGMIALQGLNVDLGKSINEGLALREKYDQWKAKKGYEADIDAADKQYQSAIAANESIGKAKEAYAQGDMAKADEAIVDAFYNQYKAGKLTNNVAIDPTTGQLKRTELATPTQDGKWKMNEAAMPTTSQLSAENRRALDYQKALSRYHMGVGDVKNAAAAKQQEERLAWRHGWTELDNDRPALLRKLAPYAALAIGDGSTFKVNDDGSVIRHTPEGKDVPFELNEAQLQQFKMQAMAYDAVSRFGEFDFLKNLTDIDKSRAAINESNAKTGYYKSKSQPEPKVYAFDIPGAEYKPFDMVDENGNKLPGAVVRDRHGNTLGSTQLWSEGVIIPSNYTKESYDAAYKKAFGYGANGVITRRLPNSERLELFWSHPDAPGKGFTLAELAAGAPQKYKGGSTATQPSQEAVPTSQGAVAKQPTSGVQPAQEKKAVTPMAIQVNDTTEDEGVALPQASSDVPAPAAFSDDTDIPAPEAPQAPARMAIPVAREAVRPSNGMAIKSPSNSALSHYREEAPAGMDMKRVFGSDASKFKLKNGATPEYNDPKEAARSGSVAMKANNPLNLRASTSAFNGQIGEYRAGKNGRFAVFKDQKHGLRAGTLNIFTQMQRLSGKNSLKDAEIPLGDLIYRYAPPSENDTQRYLQNVMKSMGVDFYKMQSDMIKFNPQFKRKDSVARVREVANAVKLDPLNKQQMAALVNAIAKQEDHKQKLLPEDIDWAIESALMEKYRQGAFGKDASYDVGE